MKRIKRYMVVEHFTPGTKAKIYDRLHQKGLLSRIESKDDTRIRVGALTAKGQRLIVPIFRKHAADIQQVFAFRAPRKRLEADWQACRSTSRDISKSLNRPYLNDGVSVT